MYKDYTVFLKYKYNSKYDLEADQWTIVGGLYYGRYGHAVSLVPKKMADFCV